MTSHFNEVQYNGVKLVELSAEDLIGQEFKTVEEADAFYYLYARVMGFIVRKREMRKSTKTGKVLVRSWNCSAEGQRRQECLNTNNMMRSPKKLTRFGCLCLLKIRYSPKTDTYVIVDFKTNHRHKLAQANESHLLVSHRFVSNFDLELATSLRKASVKPCQIYEYVADKAGGYANLTFTLKDLHNRLGARRHELLLDGDVKAAFAYLRGKLSLDKELFCRYSMDENNRLANLFWRDSESLLDYSCFGDVLVFDSTYKTNYYENPLVLFVGSNNHLLTTVFGFTLLVDENAETYTWLLKTFLQSMEGKNPLAILTNGDEAMRKAIEIVLPGCTHRLCTWHVSKKAETKLRNPDVLAAFRRCMFDEISPYNFEKWWGNMVDKYHLHDNQWVKIMYDKRRKWAKAFISGQFYARMRSTQRCEGMNRFMKDYISSCKVKMFELLPQLDKALKRLRNKVVEEDFKSNNSEQVLTTELRDLEKHASNIYTDSVFQLVRLEIVKAGGLITSRVLSFNACRVYLSYFYSSNGENECTTFHYFQESEPRIVCSCKRFECEGIPCSHSFNIMKEELIRKILASLILKRWTKLAKSSDNVSPKNLTSHGVCLEHCDNIIRDPIIVKSKGMHESIGNQGPKKKRKCSLCGRYGHKRTTCQKNRKRGVKHIARDYDNEDRWSIKSVEEVHPNN